MIMADMRFSDRLEELRLRIDSEHLGYLESEERRGEQRKRLEDYMRMFLSLAPHDRKFYLAQTAEVLRRSVTAHANFSGRRAARAWAAISKYADNLIRHPWRKEFRIIKLYCGYYKHEVEEGLVGAEQMFEAMGYRHVGNSTMVLHDVLDPDGVTNVSKDAIMAELECAILQQVWDEVSHHGVTWSDILFYRESFIGTPENAVQSLHFFLRKHHDQEQFQQRLRGNSYAGYLDNCAINNYLAYPQHQVHNYQRYAHIVNPHQVVQPSSYQLSYNNNPHILNPNELYPSNGYHASHNYNSQNMHDNGYLQHGAHYSHPTTVPTAQLIELETSPAYSAHHSHTPYPYPLPEPVRTTELPSSKAKDDGAGLWEDWDYVYRSLGNQRKESPRDQTSTANLAPESQLSERLRGMTLARSSPPPRRSDVRTRTEADAASRNRLSKSSLDLGSTASKNRLSKISLESEVDAGKTKRNKQKIDDNYKDSKISSGNDCLLNNSIIIENKVKNKQYEPTSKSETITRVAGEERPPSQIEEPVRPQNSAETQRPNVVTLDVSPSFLRDTSPLVELPSEEKWECVFCTYLNATRRNACEMCGKSRVREEIKPQPCGGQECPRCTLVNEPGMNFCAVCNHSLKNSPTYI